MRIGLGNFRVKLMITSYKSQRHCAPTRKVAGSIPNEVIGFFIDVIIPACNIAVGSNQSVT